MQRFLPSIMIAIFAVFSATLNAQVYLNEVDYDQSGTDMAEFIELVGPSGSSLNGYVLEFFTGSTGAMYDSYDLSGQTIPADNVEGFGFFVIGPAGFTNLDYNPSGWTSNAIQNGAPDGILLKLNGTIVDAISYEGDMSTVNGEFTPGMTITAADGPVENTSIGRSSLGFDSGGQDQFFAQSVEMTSPGEINTAHGQVLGGDAPPSIFNIIRTPLIPLASENTAVSAEITDDSDVILQELRYSVNGAAQTPITMNNTGGNTYSAEIPASAYNDGDRVSYTVYAEDDAAQGRESDEEGFFAGTAQIASLLDADANGQLLYLGYSARVTATATVGSGTFSPVNLDIYVQDATGGLNIFAFGGDTLVSIVVGNSYTISGPVAQFNGKSEIIPADVTTDIVDNGPGTPVQAQLLTLAELAANPEAFEGELVQVAAVSNTGNGDPWPAAGSNANVQISDASGGTLDLRVDGDTDISGSPEPTWPVSVQGIFSQFDNSSPYDEGYQLLPRSLNDIDVTVGINDSDDNLPGAFKLFANYPNPFNPETNIRYQISDIRLINLTVFDNLGRSVRTLVNQRQSSGSYVVTWDGRNDVGETVASGTYFYRLTAGQFSESRKMLLVR